MLREVTWDWAPRLLLPLFLPEAFEKVLQPFWDLESLSEKKI